MIEFLVNYERKKEYGENRYPDKGIFLIKMYKQTTNPVVYRLRITFFF